MKIVTNWNRNWVVEYKSHKYPWSLESPIYWASPIWVNSQGKLEIRRAWFENMFCNECIEFNEYSSSQLQEIKDSIVIFISEVQEFTWWHTKETKRFINILNNPTYNNT